jgi:glycosidase
MKVLKTLAVPIFFFITVNTKGIDDIIPFINLTAGITDSVLISDLFYSENYSPVFIPNENIFVSFNHATNYLILRPSENFTGLTLIGFTIGDETYEIPIFTKRKIKAEFKYHPDVKPSRVNLFGTFNNWNRASTPMHDKDGNGTYEASVALDPGRYEYKFYVDGKEISDPDNPNKTPSGVGDYNSILFIESSNRIKNYLNILGRKKKSDGIQLLFNYVSSSPNELNEKDLIVLLDNKKAEDKTIKISNRQIVIDLNKSQIIQNKILRIAVSQQGSTSNVQSVYFNTLDSTNSFYWQDAIIYSLMIDRFSDGDSSNSIPVIHPELSVKANYQGGDFNGIIKKIETGYFDSLGINALWLSPVVENTDSAYRETPEPNRYYTGYHGYWPVHPTNIEERFGNMELLKELIRKAHQHGIKILLDYVAHHVHIEHPFWKVHRDWFGQLELPDGRLNLRLWDEHRLTTWFEPYMPSFDYTKSKEALEVMTDNAVWWLKETGADGFRHDAVKHVPNEFWRMLTLKLKKEFDKEIIYQIGETFGGYELISSYVNNGQLSAQFNFNLFDAATKTFLDSNSNFSDLDVEMKKTFAVYGNNHLMGNIIDSHDKVRFMAYADGDVPPGGAGADEIGWNNPPRVDNDLSYEKLKLYFAYLLTIPGIPVIYYGDEFGMTGSSDPDNRRMMRFGSQLSSREAKTLEDVRKIIRLRKEHSALRYGDFQTLQADKNIYSFIRSDLGERILVVLNKNTLPRKADFEFPPFYNLTTAVDLITGELEKIKRNKLSVSIEPLSFKIFSIE